MNMKFLGYSIDLNIIILIGILYLIMVVNAISGSCKMEGLKVTDIRPAIDKIDRKLQNNPNMSNYKKQELREDMSKIKRMMDKVGGGSASEKSSVARLDKMLR